ncbi:MAG: DegT/DnrJ/EryC1/StrS family aminotransferase [Candidatus Aminicenantes bacterium]
MKIPLVNLKRMHEPIREEINYAIREVIDANNYINGRQIKEFETDFAQFLGVRSVIGISSGTDALFLALKVSGIQEGDYVITVPNTFIATTEAITMTGAKILFVDVEENTCNLSAKKLAILLETVDKKVANKIKAIIFVDLYGNPQHLDKIYQIAKAHDILLISDAAQAHGATIDKKPITDFAPITTYSFYPGKNLGAFGDAGAIATNNPEIAEKIRQLRNHGRTKKYIHHMEGYNCRMDTLQAAVLKVKLKYLDQWNAHRIKTAGLYNEFLSKKGMFCPMVGDSYQPVFHLYVTRSDNRDALMNKLKEAGVGVGIHYPVPLHLQPAYLHLGYKPGDFPVSEKLSETIISLPMDGVITPEEVEYICNLLP